MNQQITSAEAALIMTSISERLRKLHAEYLSSPSDNGDFLAEQIEAARKVYETVLGLRLTVTLTGDKMTMSTTHIRA